MCILKCREGSCRKRGGRPGAPWGGGTPPPPYFGRPALYSRVRSQRGGNFFCDFFGNSFIKLVKMPPKFRKNCCREGQFSLRHVLKIWGCELPPWATNHVSEKHEKNRAKSRGRVGSQELSAATLSKKLASGMPKITIAKKCKNHCFWGRRPLLLIKILRDGGGAGTFAKIAGPCRRFRYNFKRSFRFFSKISNINFRNFRNFSKISNRNF